MANIENFFQLDSQGLNYLEIEWQDLLASYSIKGEIAEKYFQEVAEKYLEKKRFYHNLSHIQALLKSAAKLRDCFQDYNSVRLAIWFHDVIYNTKKSSNEEKSAELAVKILTELNIPIATINLVEKMIIATKAHSINGLNEDGKIFLDLDLAILGASPEIYQHYHQAIRKEYSWVPWFLYRRSRRSILSGFLAREHIFFTSELAKLEQIARQNISEEITFLSK